MSVYVCLFVEAELCLLYQLGCGLAEGLGFGCGFAGVWCSDMSFAPAAGTLASANEGILTRLCT
jgi:hypothetical protein